MLVHARPRLHPSREGGCARSAPTGEVTGRINVSRNDAMDREEFAAYADPAQNIGKLVVVNDVLAAWSRVPAKPSPRPGTASLNRQRSPQGVDRTVRTFSKAVTWQAWTLIACAVSAMMLWSVAHAGDPIEDALSLIAQERYDEAQQVLDPLLERDPDSSEVRLLLGVLRARQGDFIEAISVFEGLRSDFPDMFEVHNNLAVLYAELGRLDDARGALIAALELRPDAVVYANLGDVYTRLAHRAYDRARQLNADFPAAPPRNLKADAVSEPSTEPVVSAAAATDDAEDSVTEPEEPESTAVPEQVSAHASGGECAYTENFKDLAAATEAAAWIQSRGAELVEIRHEEYEVVRNYRVYWPASSSREAAAAKVRELRRAGVRDVAVIEQGPLANAVSFGVFRNERNKNRRIAELEKLGYFVSSETNTKVVSEYEVEVRLGGDRSAFDDAWMTKFPEHAIRYAACADRG